jgi:integrase
MPQVARWKPSPPGAAVRLALVPFEEPRQLCLFDVGRSLDLEALRMERAAISEQKRAANTRSSYAWDWLDFTRWCAAFGREALPCSPDTLSLYLVDLAHRGRLVSTIERRVTSINAQHLAAGFASPAPPCGDVREVVAGLGRKLGRAPRNAKAALSVEDLRKLLDATADDGPRGCRDRTILLVGFASGLRRSDLVRLDLADVSFRREGFVLSISRSKTDQSGAGRLLGIPRGSHRGTCPVAALKRWILERGDKAGPLFCGLARPGDGVLPHRRMTGERVCELVQDAAKRAGLDWKRYGAHSLRAGCATAAAAAGASDVAIMSRTGHASAGMLKRYVRPGRLFAIDPLRGVL